MAIHLYRCTFRLTFGNAMYFARIQAPHLLPSHSYHITVLHPRVFHIVIVLFLALLHLYVVLSLPVARITRAVFCKSKFVCMCVCCKELLRKSSDFAKRFKCTNRRNSRLLTFLCCVSLMSRLDFA